VAEFNFEQNIRPPHAFQVKCTERKSSGGISETFLALGPTHVRLRQTYPLSKVARNTTSGVLLIIQCLLFFILNVKAYNRTYLTLRIQCITVGTFKGKNKFY
jgi:hypothetical protein